MIISSVFDIFAPTPKSTTMSPSQRAYNKRTFSVSFEKDLIEQLDNACAKLQIDRTALLKMAAQDFLSRLSKDEMTERSSEN